MQVFALVVALAAALYLPAVSANTVRSTTLETQEFIFANSNCEHNDTCELERVVFRVQQYELPPDDPTDITIRGTAFFAGMRTSDVESLRDFSIVQFVRGCMWNTHVDEQGNVVSQFRVVRNSHLGERGLMVHREWTVDTNDEMPTYHGDAQSGDHHYFLEWSNPIPTGVPDRQGKLLGEAKPTVPFGYITDYPGPAVLRPGIVDGQSRLEAQNSSLQFRTCVYKADDVPDVTQGSLSEFRNPIVCFTWQQSFVYNHSSGSFESPPAPHAACMRPFTAEEQRANRFLRAK